MEKVQKKYRLSRGLILFVIFAVAMTLRIGLNVARQELFLRTPFLLSEGQSDERNTGDSNWYIQAAKGFLNGRGVLSMPARVEKIAPDYMNWNKFNEEYVIHKNIPPLYPLFLALCYFIGGFNTLAYFIPQLILGSLLCLLIYLTAEEIFNERVALFAGFFVALYPDLIFWTSFVRTENLFIFLIVLGFFLLIRGNARKNFLLIYLSAAVFGLACLTRVTFTPFLPIIFLWQIYFFSRSRKEGLRVALLMGLIVFVILLPWGVRNYILFGEFDVLSEESGILIGTIENKEQYNDIEINKSYDFYDNLFLKILAFIKDNFRVYAVSCWRRFLIFWSPFTHVMKPLAKVYKGLSWLIIFPAAFWGMIFFRKNSKNGASLIIMFIIYHSMLHAASFADLGLIYRYPIQPFLCIFAAYTFNAFYKKIKQN